MEVLTDRLDYESGHRGHGDRSLGHGGHLCEESSHHHGYVWEKGCDHHGGETDDQEHVHDHGRNRNATKLKEVCGPTVGDISVRYKGVKRVEVLGIPRSSRDRLDQYACCAFHGRHRLHLDGSHIQQMQIYLSVNDIRVDTNDD